MTMDTQASFFRLLRAGLWATKPDEACFSPADTDWESIFGLALNQTVTGVVFDGVEKLPPGLLPLRPLRLRWIALVAGIEQANEKLNDELAAVSRIYTENKVPFVLLKGQGCAADYICPRRRQCGDLDLYVGKKNYRRINKRMSELGTAAAPETDKHAGFVFQDVSVENHCYAATFSSPFRNRKLQRFADGWLNAPGRTLKVNGTEVSIPAPGFNAVYLLVHSLLHFIQEGIGLRQVCDWTRLLYVYQEEIDRGRLIREVRWLKLENAFGAFGYIAVEYLGLPGHCFPFRTDKKSGEILLSDIMQGGNFGRLHAKNAGRPPSKWKGKLHTFTRVCRRCRMMHRFDPSEARWYPYFRIKSLAKRLISGEAG